MTGVFPAYAKKRNNIKYFQDIGSSSYEVVNELIPGSLFGQLSTHFIFLSSFIEYTINNSKNDIYSIMDL